MFLRNERGLGVKNGTLGTIHDAAPGTLAVWLDDGCSVAFDVKDYAAIDHGYAATIHKSQGVTVDQVHVLATPGMDRHAAYVALSRHRDGVKLHYGHDDFASDAKLAAVLSRDRAKDMAADYAADPDDAARGLALGMAMWAILAGPIVRAAPSGWHWPERMAGRSLRMPMWEGGQHLMRTASPAAFVGIVANNRMAVTNREVLEACRTRAAKAKKAVRCTIEVEVQNREKS